MFLRSSFQYVCGLIVLLTGVATLFASDIAPVIQQVLPVDRDMLEIRIHEKQVERFGPEPYVAKPGDEKVQWRNETWIKRQDKDFAALFDMDPMTVYKCSVVKGAELDLKLVTNSSHIFIQPLTTPNQAVAIHPVSIYRKSEPLEFVRTELHHYDSSMEHHLYVKLDQPLEVGHRYEIRIAEHQPSIKPFVYVHQPQQSLSPAVHVSQIGFRSDDAKNGYVSIWLGDGGAYSYDIGRRFQIINEQNGQSVYQGKLTLSKAADDATETSDKRNHNGTDVYHARFDQFKEPGHYRLFVEGIGCSYPFEIGADIWDQPFRTAAKGLYHQRSGIELGTPYTTYKRPRSHHPADGVKVIQSGIMYMDPRGKNTQFSRFKDLVKYATDQTTDTAWGGYMDAGDWDRRIDHLQISHLLFELVQSYPQYMKQVSLNIPKSNNQLPDLIDEALFNLDCYRRMQREDGAVSGGIESEAHPIFGQTSWRDTLRLYQFAPGPYATFTYAACAMHAAWILEDYDKSLASIYRDSAIKAMGWAQREVQDDRYQKLDHQLNDARNFAALMCYIVTGESHWHDLFKQTTVFSSKQYRLMQWRKYDQTNAAYYYLLLPHEKTDVTIRKHVELAQLATADRLIKSSKMTAFDWAGERDVGVGWGRLTVPQSTSLIRAYRLTGKREYYNATVISTFFGAGANPDNLSYTTGVGKQWPSAVLHVDSIRREITPPNGLTVMGPMDVRKLNGYWAMKFVRPYVYPVYENWPTTDAFWRVPIMAKTAEYTVHMTLAPNIYVWGCLAATN